MTGTANTEKPTPPPDTEAGGEGQPKYASLRVLVLHDRDSSIREAQLQLRDLDERLFEKHGIELVYINAPLISAVLAGDDGGGEIDESQELPSRIWWERASDEKQFLGLDASLLHLQQIYKSTPIIGVIGLGQGATIASLLPPMLDPILEFAIFCFGQPLMEDEQPMMPDDWCCLHVVSEPDTSNPSVQRLTKQYPGMVHVSTSHNRKLRKADLNAIGKFIVDQKKRLRDEVAKGDNAIVLQTQLHLVEQEANRVVAEHIAANPPKALMAVISPEGDVGGGTWDRRDYGQEGGGAPCPSDFLLNREKRNAENVANGPSRAHPAAGSSSNRDAADDDGEEDNV